jgi:hypothetical protein
MIDPTRFARSAFVVLAAVATLCGASMAEAQDGSTPTETQIIVPEGDANGAIVLPAVQSTVTLPAARGEVVVPGTATAAAAPSINGPISSPISAASLDALVEATPVPATLPSELECLAGAVYFEAKGESLAGQLAVARVIVARAHSGRYPGSYCGVVYQPSQFSFVRGHAMPAINHNTRFWANAARIAQIADQGSWKSPVEGALFFHATRAAPGWNKTRLAAIGGHIFYR